MYNSGRFIREAINSVLAQTYTDWELLVIDDGSTDNSVDIVREYADKDQRIRLLFNDRHIGIPSAPRNEGVRNAKGRFIAFLDSDDIWHPQKLENQLPLFKKNDVVIVYSNYEKINEQGVKTKRIVTMPQLATYKTLLYDCVIGNLTGIYDISKVGKVAFKDVHQEDYVMWLNILKKGGIALNTNTVEGEYRVVSNSLSSNKIKTLGWHWAVYRKLEHLSFFKSCYYFVHYAFNALAKALI